MCLRKCVTFKTIALRRDHEYDGMWYHYTFEQVNLEDSMKVTSTAIVAVTAAIYVATAEKPSNASVDTFEIFLVHIQ